MQSKPSNTYDICDRNLGNFEMKIPSLMKRTVAVDKGKSLHARDAHWSILTTAAVRIPPASRGTSRLENEPDRVWP